MSHTNEIPIREEDFRKALEEALGLAHDVIPSVIMNALAQAGCWISGCIRGDNGYLFVFDASDDTVDFSDLVIGIEDGEINDPNAWLRELKNAYDEYDPWEQVYMCLENEPDPYGGTKARNYKELHAAFAKFKETTLRRAIANVEAVSQTMTSKGIK